jgi:hypothetical protein
LAARRQVVIAGTAFTPGLVPVKPNAYVSMAGHTARIALSLKRSLQVSRRLIPVMDEAGLVLAGLKHSSAHQWVAATLTRTAGGADSGVGTGRTPGA